MTYSYFVTNEDWQSLSLSVHLDFVFYCRNQFIHPYISYLELVKFKLDLSGICGMHAWYVAYILDGGSYPYHNVVHSLEQRNRYSYTVALRSPIRTLKFEPSATSY
jgi:hypothetical protein